MRNTLSAALIALTLIASPVQAKLPHRMTAPPPGKYPAFCINWFGARLCLPVIL